MLLRPYQEASKTVIQVKRADETISPGQELLAILCDFNEWLGITDTQACICESTDETALYIFYRDVAFDIADFWDLFALRMAKINQIWGLCVFGTTDRQDSIRLFADLVGSSLELGQQTISGNRSEVVWTPCFQVLCNDKETAEGLMELLETLNWSLGVAAMRWEKTNFVKQQDLVLLPQSRTYFCYAGLQKYLDSKDLLESLSFNQKIDLWKSFLRDGIETTEFEWLQHSIGQDCLNNRMEWELSLHESMKQLGFHMTNQNHQFELYDQAGERRYFGANSQRPAEWAFIKILFPIND